MLLHVQIDLHAAINVTRDLDRGNMAKLAQDATKLKKGGRRSRMAGRAYTVLLADLQCSRRLQSTCIWLFAADPNAPPVPEAEKLAKEQKSSNMRGAMKFFKVCCYDCRSHRCLLIRHGPCRVMRTMWPLARRSIRLAPGKVIGCSASAKT